MEANLKGQISYISEVFKTARLLKIEMVQEFHSCGIDKFFMFFYAMVLCD